MPKYLVKRITEEIKAENEAEFQEIRKDIGDSEGRQKRELQEVENKLSLRVAKSVEKEKELEEQLNEL